MAFRVRSRSHPLLISLGLLWSAFLVLLHITWMAEPQKVPFIDRLEYLVYDLRFNFLPPQRDTTTPIVIVDIDEHSIQQEGRWPWSRQQLATLMEQLQTHEAGLIGLDISFPEHSHNPVQTLLQKPELPTELQQQLAPYQEHFDDDVSLAQRFHTNTILGYFFHNGSSSSGQLPFYFQSIKEPHALPHYKHYSSNIEILANHALNQGFIVTQADSDGVIRRLPLVASYDNGLYANFSLVIAQLALNAPWLKLHVATHGQTQAATHIELGNAVDIPVNHRGEMLIAYRGKSGSYPTLSATRIMQNQLSDKDKALLQQAIVLVGTSALGLSDLRTTPVQTHYPGVEIHANAIDTLLQAAAGHQVQYHTPDWASAASLVAVTTAGVLLGLLLPFLSPMRMLLLSVLSIAVIIAANLFSWQQWHLALPVSLQLMLTLGLAAINLSASLIITNRNKTAMQALFGAYVPPAYVERLLNTPEAANMEGEQKEMTVLFADILGFTTFSEQMSTSELKQFLNRYLTEVTGIIFHHQGTIDKYVGDMVMAFWNAPLDDPMHAQNGVLTALAMLKRTAELSAQFQQEGLPAIAIGVGLNTGPMNVGDMGSSYRRAYTVLGDAVNLGSRLEGLTRFYGLHLLVSASTAQQCPDLLLRPIDRIQVKGKTEPVDVFEPVCLLSEASKELQHSVTLFNQVVEHYRAQAFPLAQQLLQQLIQADAQAEHNRAILYQLYQERIEHYLEHPPAPEWQGVFVHTSK